MVLILGAANVGDSARNSPALAVVQGRTSWTAAPTGHDEEVHGGCASVRIKKRLHGIQAEWRHEPGVIVLQNGHCPAVGRTADHGAGLH